MMIYDVGVILRKRTKFFTHYITTSAILTNQIKKKEIYKTILKV